MRNARSPIAHPALMLILATVAFGPATVRAQAWLPEPGTGSVYLGYQYAQAHWTLFSLDVTGVKNGPYTGGPGNKSFEGEHYDQNSTLNLDYGIRHGLAASLKLAYVTSRYVGLTPHRDRTGAIMDVDNGHYHGSLQDAEVTVYQAVLHAPLVVTPFVGYVYPVKAYEARGHAATGHHLRELRLGATLARPLRPLLPDAYAQVKYTYNLAEREEDHSIHRNAVDIELGYFVTPNLSVRGAASWVRSSGGIDWNRQSAEFKRYTFVHDALANERSWRIGGGVGYILTPRWSVFAAGYATVSGASTHAMNTFASGIGWNFTAPWAR